MKKVSVIVPIYGVEKYIERSVRSLLNQSYGNIEYIFVNDCTKDKSMIILSNVISELTTEKEKKDIKIVNKPQNEGLPQARKTGLEQATGDYIIHFDSDDWVESDYIEELVTTMEANRQADVVVCSYVEEMGHDRIERIYDFKDFSPHYLVELIFRCRFHASVCNKLVKRELYDNVFFPQYGMYEDMVLMVQIFSNASKIVCNPKILYHYNRMNENALTRKRKDPYFAFANYQLIIKYLQRRGEEESYRLALSNMLNTAKSYAVSQGYSQYVKVYPESNSYIFSENRTGFLRKIMLWAAAHHISLPVRIITKIRRKL